MKPLIKLICLINSFEGNGTTDENKYSVGSIYEGYYDDTHPKHFWAVGKKIGDGFSTPSSLKKLYAISRVTRKTN